MPIDYHRQDALLGFSPPKVITVVGTGAVGCWVAYFAALTGAERLIIYTVGAVKPTDLARFPFQPQMEGEPLATALPKVLNSIRPHIQISIEGAYKKPDDRLEGVVFNCAASDIENFDNDLFEACRRQDLRYISAYYNNQTVYVTNRLPQTFQGASLEGVPAWAGSAALAGLYAVYASATLAEGSIEFCVNLSATSSEHAFKLMWNGASRPAR